MYMLCLVLLNVNGGQSFCSTEYAVVDTRENITLLWKREETEPNRQLSDREQTQLEITG